uniref:Uncharacterized protein n=1 Tax=Rhizophora mucronata TaxID=61149 RepID=A0A2P2NM11_RHIMU
MLRKSFLRIKLKLAKAKRKVLPYTPKVKVSWFQNNQPMHSCDGLDTQQLKGIKIHYFKDETQFGDHNLVASE